MFNKLIKKAMRDSLLANVVSQDNAETLTESDKESEEKKAELILSMMKIVSPGAKKGRKKRSKDHLNESSEVENTDEKKEVRNPRSRRSRDKNNVEDVDKVVEEVDPPSPNSMMKELLKDDDEPPQKIVNRSLRSRRSRTSEDSIDQLLDSPAPGHEDKRDSKSAGEKVVLVIARESKSRKRTDGDTRFKKSCKESQ